MTLRATARLALVVNLFVILWGAVVRATGSGAGCGAHWPTCDGEVLPRPKSVEMLIEFTHRATSGLALILVAWLAYRVFQERPRRHPLRRASVLAFVFIMIEAAIGAGLVLFELVAGDKSLARALVMGSHLINTLLLLAALVACWLWTDEGELPRSQHKVPEETLFVVTGALLALANFAGAIAALGDTLFPAKSLAEGFAQDMSASAHWLLRLRSAHPIVAIVAAATALALAHRLQESRHGATRERATWLLRLVAFQVLWGLGNLVLLAPLPMQIGHLLLADLVWIAFVALAIARFSQGTQGDFPPPPVIALARAA